MVLFYHKPRTIATVVKYNVPKIPQRPIPMESTEDYGADSIESAYLISPEQLKDAKIIRMREDFPSLLPKGLRYLEIGVAWGYSADYFIEKAEPSLASLFDMYDQDLKCWSWRKFGECKCDGFKHELLYLPETHEQYIIDKYSNNPAVSTVRGTAPQDLDPSLEYDYIYVDIVNDRMVIRDTIQKIKNMVPVGGYLGFNDYVIYDGVIEDKAYGTYQAVNEFLHFNKNWVVDTLALHPLGFYDIYLRRIA